MERHTDTDAQTHSPRVWGLATIPAHLPPLWTWTGPEAVPQTPGLAPPRPRGMSRDVQSPRPVES